MSTRSISERTASTIREMRVRTKILLIVGIVSWGYLVISTQGELLEIAIWSVPFVLVAGLLSTPWRTVSWSNMFLFFFIGMGPVYLLTIGVGWLLNLGPIEDFMRGLLEETRIIFIDEAVWAPITEELFKVTPLLLLAAWTTTSFRTLAGPIDYAVIAGATGAGFAFAEDISVHIAQGSLNGPASSIFALNIGPLFRDLVGSTPDPFSTTFSDTISFILPEAQGSSSVVFIGHGALAFGIGLSIGLSVWAFRRFKTRLWFAVPVIVYLWAVWEHMMANWHGGAGCGTRDFLLCTLAEIDLHGRIYPIALLLGFGLAALMSRNAILKLKQTDPTLDSEGFSMSAYSHEGLRGRMAFGRDWLDFRRWRRKVAYGVDRVLRAKDPSSWDKYVVLATRWRASYIRRRLVGHERAEIEPEIKRLVEALTPLD